jgi:hypothetical protein
MSCTISVELDFKFLLHQKVKKNIGFLFFKEKETILTLIFIASKSFYYNVIRI